MTGVPTEGAGFSPGWDVNEARKIGKLINRAGMDFQEEGGKKNASPTFRLPACLQKSEKEMNDGRRTTSGRKDETPHVSFTAADREGPRRSTRYLTEFQPAGLSKQTVRLRIFKMKDSRRASLSPQIR